MRIGKASIWDAANDTCTSEHISDLQKVNCQHLILATVNASSPVFAQTATTYPQVPLLHCSVFHSCPTNKTNLLHVFALTCRCFMMWSTAKAFSRLSLSMNAGSCTMRVWSRMQHLATLNLPKKNKGLKRTEFFSN